MSFTVILIHIIFVLIGTLCYSGYSNPDDVAECRTMACMYLEFQLLDRLLWFIDGICTAIIISVQNGFCSVNVWFLLNLQSYLQHACHIALLHHLYISCVVCCHAWCRGCLATGRIEYLPVCVTVSVSARVLVFYSITCMITKSGWRL
jgi:hypothetical protein